MTVAINGHINIIFLAHIKNMNPVAIILFKLYKVIKKNLIEHNSHIFFKVKVSEYETSKILQLISYHYQ